MIETENRLFTFFLFGSLQSVHFLPLWIPAIFNLYSTDSKSVNKKVEEVFMSDNSADFCKAFTTGRHFSYAWFTSIYTKMTAEIRRLSTPCFLSQTESSVSQHGIFWQIILLVRKAYLATLKQVMNSCCFHQDTHYSPLVEMKRKVRLLWHFLTKTVEKVRVNLKTGF